MDLFGWPFRPFSAVFRARLFAITNTRRVERTADYVIAHTRQILDAAPADQHNRVLLQVVSHARNIGSDLDSVGEPHTRYFTERGVRLFRRGGINTRANP